MAKWTAFPHAGDYAFDAASLKKGWARLHQGDCIKATASRCPKTRRYSAPGCCFTTVSFKKHMTRV